MEIGKRRKRLDWFGWPAAQIVGLLWQCAVLVNKFYAEFCSFLGWTTAYWLVLFAGT